MRNQLILSLLFLLFLFSCNEDKLENFASGTFEAVETIISAEADGALLHFEIEEGQTIPIGKQIGYVDSMQIYFKKKQLEAQINALRSKRPNVDIQLSSSFENLRKAEIDQRRIINLRKDGAATAKQLEDINSHVEVLKKQIEAQRSSLEISKNGLSEETIPVYYEIEQLNDLLHKCKIINPINGTVLTKYAEPFEMTAVGKPLYKIADLRSIILRVFISADQLPRVKINQVVKVFIDYDKNSYYTNEGVITWISDKAEFTPKTIQTKNERADKVYAIKVQVPNSGIYKIGMYGEISLDVK